MIHISMLVDYVKSRLGVSHRSIELSDESIVRCLEQETLKTLSIYAPYYCQAVCNMNTSQVVEGMNTYFVPEDPRGEFELIGVEYLLPISSGMSNSNMFYLPSGSDLQSIISGLAMTKLGNSISAATVNPVTFTFLAPNTVRLYATYGQQNMMMVLRTTHKKDFTTFPFGMLETIKELALLDVALDIYSIRKHFSNVQTIFAQIQLDMDFYNSAPDRRRDLLEKLRARQQRFSNTKKIYCF